MTLTAIRKKLDSIDQRLVKLLAERQSYMALVGEYKRKNKLPYYQPKKEEEILTAKKALALERGLDPVLVQKVFALVFKHSRKLQKIATRS